MNQAWLFNQGENYQSYKMLGARPRISPEGEPGYSFAVWAPHASSVSVVGDFNGWDPSSDSLIPYGTTGIWTGFVPGAVMWQRYKYAVRTASGRVTLKADPFARHAETRPSTASILYDGEHDYEWGDGEYMVNRPDVQDIGPLNIYEVHLGSWRRYGDGHVKNYRDIAPELASYCLDMGYNAVELMPVMEYPLDASWGYQVTGYFAATSRYGTPADLKFLIDTLHQAGLRVILDWVPSHFPKDDFALARFDGQPLFEDPDSRRGEHGDWGTLVFNYGLAEVQSFLLSSAWFWLDEFHADGLRVDAVSSMLYLDFGRPDAVPNDEGSFLHLEAIDFLKSMNAIIREHFPHAIMAAEESTPYPEVTTPVSKGGLGFTHKWNMGWMNDTLSYMEHDYYARGKAHEKLSFSMMYAFSERFILPFSHDEVVHGKKSLLGRMPGDDWRRFASLRACYMYQMSHPGAKLNFMGNEYAPYLEWRYYEELEWFMLEYPLHRAMHGFVRELNHFYLEHKALWEVDDSWEGFLWLDADDRERSVYSYARRALHEEQLILVLLNMTPASYEQYPLRVPYRGRYRLLLNSDDPLYGGSAYQDLDVGRVFLSEDLILKLPVPPLAGMYLLYEGEQEKEA